MSEATRRQSGTQMAKAALALLDALTPQQRERATWAFPSDDERQRWFYTPTDHGGLPLAEMDSTQHRLAYRLLASGLSEGGYNTVASIIGTENILDYKEGFSVDFGRPRGRDPLLYWVAVFGTPGPGATWSWRFGGHHVSLHFTIVAGVVRAATPCFFGADPANSALLGPHMHRPLGGAEDLGRELVRSLSAEQAAAAVSTAAPPVDIVGGNRVRLTEGDQELTLLDVWRETLFSETMADLLTQMQLAAERRIGISDADRAVLAFSDTPKGLPVSALTDAQAEITRALLAVYIDRIHDDLADAEWAKVSGPSFGRLHFMWAGSFEPGEPHYYRIQGGDLLVEYDNTQRGGNHIHAVWRDLSNDFGHDPLRAHYNDAGGHHQH